MRKPVLRRGIAVLCVLAGAAALGGCAYDPYTGTYVPCCAYRSYYASPYYGYGYTSPYYAYPYAYRGY